MSAAVRPIHVPGATARESLRQRAQAALDAWARDWVSGHASGAQATPALHVCPVHEGDRSRDRERYDALCTQTGVIWFRCTHDDRFSFDTAVAGAGLLADCSYADEWIAGVTDDAWDARNHALCSALLGSPIRDAVTTPPSAGLLAFGSGAVELSCAALGLHAIADSAVWRSVPPSERAAASSLVTLTPLDRAVQRARVALDIMLGSVEVELPKLLDLRCGDVLRLPQRLDQRIAVLCAGKPLARAVLGETQGRKCVQLLADDQ